VVPNPRSNGCALNLPYFSVSVSVSTARRFGFWNPLQSMLYLRTASTAKHSAAAVPFHSVIDVRLAAYYLLLLLEIRDQVF
jgi:hypothetical protein